MPTCWPHIGVSSVRAVWNNVNYSSITPGAQSLDDMQKSQPSAQRDDTQGSQDGKHNRLMQQVDEQRILAHESKDSKE